MTRKILVIGMMILLLTACAGVHISNETSDVAIDVSASTIGYLIGKNNPDQIDKWIGWGNKILEIIPGQSIESFEKILTIGIEIAVDDEFLEMQAVKLIRLLDFPDLQPSDLPFLQEKYVERVRLVVSGFLDGLRVVEGEIED